MEAVDDGIWQRHVSSWEVRKVDRYLLLSDPHNQSAGGRHVYYNMHARRRIAN
jgi:hypothetical protein